GGLRDENITLIHVWWIVGEDRIDVPVDRVDDGVREFVATETRRRCCSLPGAGQREVAVCSTNQAGSNGYSGGKGQSLVCGLAHVNSRTRIQEHVNGVIGTDGDKRALAARDDLRAKVGTERG